jgi:hypothetical protein
MRLKGQGLPGSDGKPGDAYVEVSFSRIPASRARAMTFSPPSPYRSSSEGTHLSMDWFQLKVPFLLFPRNDHIPAAPQQQFDGQRRLSPGHGDQEAIKTTEEPSL